MKSWKLWHCLEWNKSKLFQLLHCIPPYLTLKEHLHQSVSHNSYAKHYQTSLLILLTYFSTILFSGFLLKFNMATKSDFAQKLLGDLRLRKEKMAASQNSSRQSSQTPRGEHLSFHSQQTLPVLSMDIKCE